MNAFSSRAVDADGAGLELGALAVARGSIEGGAIALGSGVPAAGEGSADCRGTSRPSSRAAPTRSASPETDKNTALRFNSSLLQDRARPVKAALRLQLGG